MKTDLFQSCDHCWVFLICWHIECSTFTTSSSKVWNSSTGIPSPPLALRVVMLPKAYLTSHSRISGSWWVITPSWWSGSWRLFLYSSSVYSCHLFRVKLKKVEKTTRPFRYDLNQIPYDYTVEVRNSFKGLDLIDRVPDEVWMDVHDIVQETGIKTMLMQKKCNKGKWMSEEALQIAVKIREAKSKGEKERYTHLNA